MIRFLKATSVTLLALTGLIGFAHTRTARPALFWVGRHVHVPGASCPLGFDRTLSAEDREAGRQRFAQTHRGAAQASARPALGFALEATTRADVLSWASAHGVRCSEPRFGADLDCEQVPASALPAGMGAVGPKTLWLNFGGDGKLIAVMAVRSAPGAAQIAAAYQALVATLSREAGRPLSAQQASAAELSAGLLRQSSAEYRFRDYYAVARATNMGAGGFVITEEYRAL